MDGLTDEEKKEFKSCPICGSTQYWDHNFCTACGVRLITDKVQ